MKDRKTKLPYDRKCNALQREYYLFQNDLKPKSSQNSQVEKFTEKKKNSERVQIEKKSTCRFNEISQTGKSKKYIAGSGEPFANV